MIPDLSPPPGTQLKPSTLKLQTLNPLPRKGQSLPKPSAPNPLYPGTATKCSASYGFDFFGLRARGTWVGYKEANTNMPRMPGWASSVGFTVYWGRFWGPLDIKS